MRVPSQVQDGSPPPPPCARNCLPISHHPSRQLQDDGPPHPLLRDISVTAHENWYRTQSVTVQTGGRVQDFTVKWSRKFHRAVEPMAQNYRSQWNSWKSRGLKGMPRW